MSKEYPSHFTRVLGNLLPPAKPGRCPRPVGGIWGAYCHSLRVGRRDSMADPTGWFPAV